MHPYTVIYVENAATIEYWQFFQCLADDADHAEEQCVNAYPNCSVLWVNEGHGPDAQKMEGW